MLECIYSQIQSLFSSIEIIHVVMQKQIKNMRYHDLLHVEAGKFEYSKYWPELSLHLNFFEVLQLIKRPDYWHV